MLQLTDIQRINLRILQGNIHTHGFCIVLFVVCFRLQSGLLLRNLDTQAKADNLKSQDGTYNTKRIGYGVTGCYIGRYIAKHITTRLLYCRQSRSTRYGTREDTIESVHTEVRSIIQTYSTETPQKNKCRG